MILINSLKNQKVKDLEKLKKTVVRKKNNLVLIDGKREIESALEAQVEVNELIYCSEIAGDNNYFLKNISEEKIVNVSKPVFEKICYKEKPDGYLALAKTKDLKLSDIKAKNPLIIILEAVEKPGNLGAIIRTAYATGVDAIILNDSQTDIYNPNVIRASEGFVFKVKIVKANRLETVTWLKEQKINSYAAATGAKINYTKENLSGSIAIILGTEADGLSKDWLKAADKIIKIPMKTGIDSLNVSVSAAIILYEALRQRQTD